MTQVVIEVTVLDGRGRVRASVTGGPAARVLLWREWVEFEVTLPTAVGERFRVEIVDAAWAK